MSVVAWFWHGIMDGTRLCPCAHSRWMRRNRDHWGF
jgi:hypothetical protein